MEKITIQTREITSNIVGKIFGISFLVKKPFTLTFWNH